MLVFVRYSYRLIPREMEKKEQASRFCVDDEVNVYGGCVVATVMWDVRVAVFLYEVRTERRIVGLVDRSESTRLNSSHSGESRMPSSA